MRSRMYTVVLTFASVAGAVAAPPVSKPYPFQVPPAKAIPIIGKLTDPADKPVALCELELKLFADAGDGKLDEVSFAEACLIASGVTDQASLKGYLKKIEEIEAGARKACDGATTVHEKGKRLLEYLHAGPMAKGYLSHQTDLHTVLDTGKFNCVSSAVLYNVIGRRLGLDCWAIEIPEHVFSYIHDGEKRYDVETTNKLGFDPSRDPEARKKVMPAGKAYMPERHAKDRREINDLQLAAVICSNQEVELGKQHKHAEAIRACFRTLCLDPTHEQAAHNALAHFTNWGNDLMKEEKFEQALVVIGVGLELAPKDHGLLNNRKVAWVHYADAKLKNGTPAEALAILRRAAKQIGEKELQSAEADLFLRRGQELLKAGKWDEALALGAEGLKLTEGDQREKVRSWRNGLFLNKSNDRVKKGEYEAALNVLKEGQMLDPTYKGFQQNTLATYDNWADTFMKKKDWAGAIEIYRKGLKELPDDKHLAHNLKYCEQQAKK